MNTKDLLIKKSLGMNMMIALKIKEFYPDKLITMSIYDEDTFKYSAGLFSEREDGMIGEMLYSFDKYEFNNEEMAVNAMKREVEKHMEVVKVMSN